MTTSSSSQAGKSTVVSGIVLTVLSGLSFACTGFVANELAAFTGPAWEQEDDVTLVILQRSAFADMPDDSDEHVLAEFEIASEPGNEREAMERVVSAVAGLGLVLATNVREMSKRQRMSRVTLGWTVLAGAGFAIAFGSFYTALATIDFSVGAPVLGSVPLVSYAVALVILRGEERITRRALGGAVLVVAGVGIIGAVG